jgi:hypothetical protein
VVGLQPVTSGQPPDEAAARGELPTFKGYPHRITTQNRLYSLVFVYFSIPKLIKVKKPDEYSPGTLTDEYSGVTDKLKKIIPTIYFPISFLSTHIEQNLVLKFFATTANSNPRCLCSPLFV